MAGGPVMVGGGGVWPERRRRRGVRREHTGLLYDGAHRARRHVVVRPHPRHAVAQLKVLRMAMARLSSTR